MQWIFLSPHFDDVAFSCGGLVWELVQAGSTVGVWTVCAGEPPGGVLSPFANELHARWEAGQNAPAWRRTEDLKSCKRLKADSLYLGLPDCIYRRHPQTGEFLYASNAALNGPIQPGDVHNLIALQADLKQHLPSHSILVCPLGLGNHVDHQLTRLAAEGLDLTAWYYADFPYVLQCGAELEKLEQEDWFSQVFPLSQDGLLAWQDSIAAHASQISTFWASEAEMRQAVAGYLHWNNGIRLWRRFES